MGWAASILQAIHATRSLRARGWLSSPQDSAPRAWWRERDLLQIQTWVKSAGDTRRMSQLQASLTFSPLLRICDGTHLDRCRPSDHGTPGGSFVCSIKLDSTGQCPQQSTRHRSICRFIWSGAIYWNVTCTEGSVNAGKNKGGTTDQSSPLTM